MRNRNWCLFLALAFFLVSGCSLQKQVELKPEDILLSFQCKANITAGEQKYSCILSHSAPGIGSVQVTSGDLNGLIYNWSGENFSVSYSGVTAESEECVLPKSSFAALLQSVLNTAERDGTLVKTHGNEFSGTGDGYDFTVIVDAGTGQIQTITVPQYAISVNLSDYSELGI